MSSKTVKAPGWQPQQAPPKKECGAMRQIIVEAVMSLFHESDLPLNVFAADLNQIYRRSQKKVRKLRDNGEWTYPYRGKRTWDRRVNEAASERSQNHRCHSRNVPSKSKIISGGFFVIAHFIVRLGKRELISTPYFWLYKMYVDQLDYAENPQLIYEVKK